MKYLMSYGTVNYKLIPNMPAKPRISEIWKHFMKVDAFLFFTFRSLSRGAVKIISGTMMHFVRPVIGGSAIDQDYILCESVFSQIVDTKVSF